MSSALKIKFLTIYVGLVIASHASAGTLTLNDTGMRGGENIGSFFFSGRFIDTAATECDLKIHMAARPSHLARQVLLNSTTNNQNAPLVLRLTDTSHSEITASGENQFVFNFVNIKRHPKGQNRLYVRARARCLSEGQRKIYFSQIASFDFTEGINLGSSANITKLASHLRSRYQP